MAENEEAVKEDSIIIEPDVKIMIIGGLKKDNWEKFTATLEQSFASDENERFNGIKINNSPGMKAHQFNYIVG